MSQPPPRPHALSVSPFACRADRLIKELWDRKITPKPPLDPEFLWQIGARGYTSEDEVSCRSADEVDDFRERLARLCHSLREEADLNALGHTMAYGQLKKAIRERHALGRLWRTRPELARTAIAAPIIVAGQMRSGTTRVHRLLAADPAHCGTRFCDSHHPVPARPDLRPLISRAALAMARRINPWLDTLHPFSPTRVDEEIGWLASALSPPSYEAQWHVPSYVSWSEGRDPAPVYAEFARILRTDAAHHGNADRTRILKCPQFSEDLPALVAQFPGARIVSTAREQNAVWASAVSMVACQSAFQTCAPALAPIESAWMRKIAMRERRLNASLAQLPNPVARVTFEQLNRDWREAMRAVYDALGAELTDAALAAMEAELARSEGDWHRHHSRDIAGFGLTASEAGRIGRRAAG
ncbi:sulfotransferase family protein [Qipengyuania sp.]|uniref:sulfotransferase family protein n=1 Tax=Qipengyuania sp. TaxID=2004515 RepID=UPI003735CFE9